MVQSYSIEEEKDILCLIKSGLWKLYFGPI